VPLQAGDREGNRLTRTASGGCDRRHPRTVGAGCRGAAQSLAIAALFGAQQSAAFGAGCGNRIRYCRRAITTTFRSRQSHGSRLRIVLMAIAGPQKKKKKKKKKKKIAGLLILIGGPCDLEPCGRRDALVMIFPAIRRGARNRILAAGSLEDRKASGTHAAAAVHRGGAIILLHQRNASALSASAEETEQSWEATSAVGGSW